MEALHRRAAEDRLMDSAKLRHYTARLVGEDRADPLLAAHEGSAFERWNAVMTDHTFAVPATRLLEAQGAFAPTYTYRFDWRSPLLGGVLGSCHALELGFVFGTYNEKLAGAFFGSGAKADALSSAMMDAWIAFARTGDPSNALGTWPRYDTAKRATMIFGDGDPHVVDAPDDIGARRGMRSRREYWSLTPVVIPGEYRALARCEGSDCLGSQAICQGLLSLMMALRMVRSFLATAMMATILGFPAAMRRSRKSLRTGL